MAYYVYKHTFPNGKVYIGITCLKPENRWADGKGYLKVLKNGEYHQPLMARAVLKYGWENITHEILFNGLSKEEAEAKEIALIAEYNSNKPQYGYNIREGGGASKHSESTKKKMSEAAKKRGIPEETIKKAHDANRGRQLTEDHKRKVGASLQGIQRSEETKQKISNSKKKPILCVELGVVYESGLEAEEKTGALRSKISVCCKNPNKTAGGYHWAYYEETKEAA